MIKDRIIIINLMWILAHGHQKENFQVDGPSSGHDPKKLGHDPSLGHSKSATARTIII